MLSNVKGMLKKRKTSKLGKIIGKTNTRYFVIIFEAHIFGYKKLEKDSYLKFSMKFVKILNYSIELSNEEKKGIQNTKFGFKVMTQSKSLILFSENQEDYKKWIDAFKVIMQMKEIGSEKFHSNRKSQLELAAEKIFNNLHVESPEIREPSKRNPSSSDKLNNMNISASTKNSKKEVNESSNQLHKREVERRHTKEREKKQSRSTIKNSREEPIIPTLPIVIDFNERRNILYPKYIPGGSNIPSNCKSTNASPAHKIKNILSQEKHELPKKKDHFVNREELQDWNYYNNNLDIVHLDHTKMFNILGEKYLKRNKHNPENINLKNINNETILQDGIIHADITQKTVHFQQISPKDENFGEVDLSLIDKHHEDLNESNVFFSIRNQQKEAKNILTGLTTENIVLNNKNDKIQEIDAKKLLFGRDKPLNNYIPVERKLLNLGNEILKKVEGIENKEKKEIINPPEEIQRAENMIFHHEKKKSIKIMNHNGINHLEKDNKIHPYHNLHRIFKNKDIVGMVDHEVLNHFNEHSKKSNNEEDGFLNLALIGKYHDKEHSKNNIQTPLKNNQIKDRKSIFENHEINKFDEFEHYIKHNVVKFEKGEIENTKIINNIKIEETLITVEDKTQIKMPHLRADILEQGLLEDWV
jgi:hypothetical protein